MSTRKHQIVQTQIELFLRVPSSITDDGETKMWARYITGVDLSKPGGYALIGGFLRGTVKNVAVPASDEVGVIYNTNTLLKDRVIVACAQVGAPARRAVFVIFPDDRADVHTFPNVVAKPGAHGTKVVGSIDAISYSYYVSCYVRSQDYLVAAFVSRETHDGKNSLVCAAEFIDSNNILGKQSGPPYTTPPQPADGSTLVVVPHVEEKPKQQKARVPVKEKYEPVVFTHKQNIAVPGKNVGIPPQVTYLGEVDGIKLLSKDGAPRLMHILADYGNITDRLRRLMLDQADRLEAVAAAYRLSATIGADDDELKEILDKIAGEE